MECTPRSTVDDIGTTTNRRELRVAELAAAADVTADTIRYYERSGPLPEPARSAAGSRLYDPAILERLRFIQGCQRLALTLRDIGDLLAIRDTGVCPCEPAAELLQRRLAEVDAEMVRLAALRAEMIAMAQALPAEDCPHLGQTPAGAHLARGGDLDDRPRSVRLLRQSRLPPELCGCGCDS